MTRPLQTKTAVCVAVALGFTFAPIVVRSAFAQRVELSGTFTVINPRVDIAVCCYLRTPPSFVETDERYHILEAGAEGRVFWRDRLSLLFDVRGSAAATRAFSYSRPEVAPQPILPGQPSQYVARRASHRRVWAFDVAQSVDFGHSRRWKPWIAGGMSLEHAANDYEQTSALFLDPATTSVLVLERDQTTTSLLGDAGVRWFATKRTFLNANGTFRAAVRSPAASFSKWLWRAGGGFRF